MTMTIATRAYRVAFRDWFGLRPAQAEILVQLFGAAGECIADGTLARAAGVKLQSVKVYICDLRKALNSEAIDSVPGMGYRLTEGGLDECKGALWSMGEELRRAG